MMEELCSLMKSGKLRSPKTLPFEFDDYKKALLTATGSEYVDGKPVLVHNE